MKRDFLVVQASPQVPANFATVPSLAARPVSRIASMDSEVVDPSADTPTSMESMEDADTTPIFPATHKEKEKAETAVSVAANRDITSLGGKILATEGG
ncbi:hypothetical protein B0H11DRAFT_2244851 [Mycena galericulata]|nr:hypothetical protein B0H11DRAFT_2244851 [Mycena galericulata]